MTTARRYPKTGQGTERCNVSALWERVWGCCSGSAEEAERELDEEEDL